MTLFQRTRYNVKQWKFSKVPCPHCGKQIAANWLERHIQKDHPEKKETKPDGR